jgi:cardiolipin synthase
MIFRTILLIINIVLVLSVVFTEHKNPNEALMWVIILTFFPVGGIVLYLIFGSTIGIKFNRWVRDRKIHSQYRRLLHKQLDQIKYEHFGNKEDSSEQIQNLVQFNTNYSKSILLKHNQIEQITTGVAAYTKLFTDILQARETVHVQYYAIQNDIVGQKLIEILTQKAKEKVKVKLMFDSLGSLGVTRSMLSPLIEAGGEIHRLKPFITHFRNHKKIVVIDGRIGYIGGMNIGKKYINLDKKKTPWRDSQIRIKGDGVYMLQYYFMSDWLYSAQLKQLAKVDYDLEQLFPLHSVSYTLYAQFVTGGPDDDQESIKMSYLKMISSAKEKILLQSPYFIPDSSILDALKTAAASGVEVHLMLPEIRPNFFLNAVNHYYIDQIIAYGAHIWKYKGYIHAKTMSIDSLATCIGSVNLDMRSFYVDDEICGFVYDEAFAADYELIFQKDRENCYELDYRKFKNRSPISKMMEKLFNLFSPLM